MPPRFRAILVGVAGLFLSASPQKAAAQDGRPELGFSADEVSGDMRLRELSLRGNVVLTYERFRLTSPELVLRRSTRGIEVEGQGEVVFCPCPDPPVTVGFAEALVAPPADLLLRQPRLRIGGVTVFALPWFWLRAPTRAGILPPVVAWRGGDGLLLGEGVHLPWKTSDGYDELDLTAAGYVKGGFEVTARLRTAGSTNRVRWDHLRGDLFAVDAHGASAQPLDGAVAWDLDAIGGARARAATLSLDEASRGYDRASAESIVHAGHAVVGLGVREIGARGGTGPSVRPAWGPRLSVGSSGAIGAIGVWDALSTLTVLNDAEAGVTELGRVAGSAELAARPGPFAARFGIREVATLAEARDARGFDALALARADVGLPLVRPFATEGGPLLSVIEPKAEASLAIARTSGAYWSNTGRPIALASGKIAMSSVGLRTAWGRYLGRSGGTLEASVGGVQSLTSASAERTPADGPVGARGAARWRGAWGSQYVGFGGEGAVLLDGTRGQVTTARLRLGRRDGMQLALGAAGRTGVEPVLGRAFATPDATEPSGGWLAREGWSASAEVGGRLTDAVEAKLGAEGDVSQRTLLGIRGSTGYTHPCRCLSVFAFVARRLGREGVDVWVSIDLAPR